MSKSSSSLACDELTFEQFRKTLLYRLGGLDRAVVFPKNGRINVVAVCLGKNQAMGHIRNRPMTMVTAGKMVEEVFTRLRKSSGRPMCEDAQHCSRW